MNEYSLLSRFKYEVRAAENALIVWGASVAQGLHQLANAELYAGVGALDSPHIFGSLVGVVSVHPNSLF